MLVTSVLTYRDEHTWRTLSSLSGHIMDNLVPCCYCSGLVQEEGLQCSNCQRKYHFRCGTGLDNITDRTITKALKDVTFKCSLCKVGEKNALIHTVITINQAFNEAKHAAEFHPGDLVEDVAIVTDHTPVAEATEPVLPTQPGDGVPPVLPTQPGDGVHPVAGAEPGTREAEADTRRRGPSLSSNGTPVDVRNRFRTSVNKHELRRIKRCKGMLYGIKHVNPNTKTLLILDSNGRGVRDEDIDSDGSISIKSVGGLCVSATTTALKECKARYPQIKTLVFGLGTNDRLHARDHPGTKEEYIKALDSAAKVVFPTAVIQFILPFGAIKGLCEEFIRDLGKAITNSGVGWRQHKPPTMKGKLMPPNNIHLTESGRQAYIVWLRKVFAPQCVAPSKVAVSNAPNPDLSHQNLRVRDDTNSVDQRVRVSDNVSSNEASLNRSTLINQGGETNFSRLFIDTLIKDRLYEILAPPGSDKHLLNRPWPWR